MIAGHDTIANTLSWLLYELSKHPKDQQRIRDEIRAAKAHVEARGDDDLLPSDLNGMAFTNAVIKVGPLSHHLHLIFIRLLGGASTSPNSAYLGSGSNF